MPDVGVIPTVLPGEPASPLNPPTGCAFHPRCPQALDACSDPNLQLRLARVGPGGVDRLACINPRPVPVDIRPKGA